MQFLFNKCLGCVFGNAFGLKIIFPRLTFSKSACKFCLESLQLRGLINCSQLFKSVKIKKLSRVCPHLLKSLTNQVLSNLWFQVNRRRANSLRIFNVWKRLRNVLKGHLVVSQAAYENKLTSDLLRKWPRQVLELYIPNTWRTFADHSGWFDLPANKN